MRTLPVRGPAVRELGRRLPPARMAPLHRGRPLKRWRYLGVYGPELMLCVGDARVCGVPQRWWAVALPDGSLFERTTGRRGGVLLEPGRVHVRAAAVEIDLRLDEPDAVEVLSPHGSSWIWTAKRAPVGGSWPGTDRRAGVRPRRRARLRRRVRRLPRAAHGVALVGRARPDRGRTESGVEPRRGGARRSPGERAHRLARRRASRGRAAGVRSDLSAVGGLRFSAWAERRDRAGAVRCARTIASRSASSRASCRTGSRSPPATASWSGTTRAGEQHALEIGRELGPLLMQMAPGDADGAPAGRLESAVAAPVALEGAGLASHGAMLPPYLRHVGPLVPQPRDG